MDRTESVVPTDQPTTRPEPTTWRRRWLPGVLTIGGSLLAAFSVFWSANGISLDTSCSDADRLPPGALPDGADLLIIAGIGAVVGAALLHRISRSRGFAALCIGLLLLGSVYLYLRPSECDTRPPSSLIVMVGLAALAALAGGATAWWGRTEPRDKQSEPSFGAAELTLLVLAMFNATIALSIKAAVWAGRLWSEHDGLLCDYSGGEVPASWATRIAGIVVAVVTALYLGARQQRSSARPRHFPLAIITILIALLPTLLFWGQPVYCYD